MRLQEVRKPDNRIPLQLPVNHPSRAHHIHAANSALASLDVFSFRAILSL